MCHHVSHCVPGSHMLINADLCLIMLIYRKATGALVTSSCQDAAAFLLLLLLLSLLLFMYFSVEPVWLLKRTLCQLEVINWRHKGLILKHFITVLCDFGTFLLIKCKSYILSILAGHLLNHRPGGPGPVAGHRHFGFNSHKIEWAIFSPTLESMTFWGAQS